MASPKTYRLLLAAFVVLGAVFALVTPLFEISDELWHYPMVKTLADGDGLPVQDPASVQPWRQEGSQPPLYYALMAAATFWIDTRDLAEVRWINPHTDNGLITEDRNNNIVIHRPDEPGRWYGTALAVRLIRLLSILLGAATVYFTYRFALELVPGDVGLALAAAGVAAFTPMFIFISASVNNDNLAVTLSAAALWRLARWVRQPPERLGWSHIVLGLVLGAGALGKQSALGLFPLAGGALFFANLQQVRRHPQPFQTGRKPSAIYNLQSAIRNTLIQLLPIFGAAGLVAFWWYWRNWQLYGDWLGWNTFIAIVGARSQPATLAQIWGERVGLVQAYWGLFGGVSVPMPDWTYIVLNAIVGLALVGLVIGVARAIRARRVTLESIVLWGLPVVWIGSLLYGLIRWTSMTWASQGRLIFPAISAISLLIVVGLNQIGRLLPSRYRLSAIVYPPVAFMAVLAAAAPLAVIAPHYTPPPELASTQIAAIPNRLDADFGGEMRMLGYDLRTNATPPGGAVRLTLYWQSLIAMDRNWSIFVHVIDDQGVIVGQRDRYPGQGLLATTLLRPGQTFADEYMISIPAGAYAPTPAHIAVGLYDLADGARLGLPDNREAVVFGDVSIVADANSGPKALRQNFGGQIELTGYAVSARALRPGESLQLTLYWQALAPIRENYAVSARVRSADGLDNTRWAAEDAWPQKGAAPTSAWRVGETVTDEYMLTLRSDTPPGQFAVEIVLYDSTTLTPLRLVAADGRPTDAESVWLNRLRVTP